MGMRVVGDMEGVVPVNGMQVRCGEMAKWRNGEMAKWCVARSVVGKCKRKAKAEGRGDRTPDRWDWNPALYH
jgi:hypothetical protein